VAKEDVIKAEIGCQIDLLFKEIHQLLIEIDKREAKDIDNEIRILWDNFRDGLAFFLHKKKVKSQSAQKTYILYSESYFSERRVEYEKKHPQGHRINLRPKTHFSEPPPRNILSTEIRLQQGRKHVHIADILKEYWQSPSLDLSSADLIWGNLYLSLIYYSGCYDLQHLVSIGRSLLSELKNNDSNLYCKLYHSDYKTIINPLVLTYKLQHSYYGNEINHKIIYQWRQVWINPYAIFLYQAILSAEFLYTEQTPRYVLDAITVVLHQIKKENHNSEAFVKEVLQDLNKLTRATDEKVLDVGPISAFKHVHLGFEYDSNLNLDMALSQVLQQNLKTVALSSTDQKYIWLEQELRPHQSDSNKGIINLPIQVETLAEFKTAAENLKSIPFELVLFEKSQSLSQHKRQKKQEKIKWLRWSKIQKSLQQQRDQASGKEKNIIEAQLRLLAWIFELKKQKIKLSSVERYLSSIAKYYLFHIYLYEDDIESMTDDNYEFLYQNILSDIDQRDQAKAVKNPLKNQNRAQYAFGRLKAFHQFCVQQFNVPNVGSFKSSQFQRVQICDAKLVSPRQWHELKRQLMVKIQDVSTLQEKRYLQQLIVMYILAYRLGLRLNEVRGLSLGEIIAPELLWKDINQSIEISLILKHNPYRRLKSENAKRQLHLNLVLLQDEMDYVKAYLKQRIDNLSNKATLSDILVFAENEEILSEKSITDLTKLLFDKLMDDNHGYTFHNFRHSAANQLAIAWLGSKHLIKTYTDYTWQQVKHMRQLLFGEAALQHEQLIQHKWRLLADWMGHGNIEQTASNYLHVLDLLAIDRIYQAPCFIDAQIFHNVVKTKSKGPSIDLKRYIQSHQAFKLYQQAKVIAPFEQYTEIKFEKPQCNSVYAVVRDYIDQGLGEEHEWNQRAIWLARKLLDPGYFKSIWQVAYAEDQLDPKPLFNLYAEAVKKKFTLQYVDSKAIDQQDKVKESMVYTLKAFLDHAKVRKNFIHFQCRFDKNGEFKAELDIEKIKEGLYFLKLDYAVTVFENYPVNTDIKSRVIKLSFIDRDSNKNITLSTVFSLLLHIIECDQLWEIA
jgi:integrase